MNLNREELKALIAEALEEVVPSQEVPQEPDPDENLDRIEREVSSYLKKMFGKGGKGELYRKMVQRAATTTPGKARMLTIIAAAFGIKALDAKSGLSSAADKLGAREQE